MSYLLHRAATTSTRPMFADFKLKYAFEGPGKIAHIFTVVGAIIPFYLFSSAYRGSVGSPSALAESRYQQSMNARLAGDDPYLIYRQRTLAERRSKS